MSRATISTGNLTFDTSNQNSGLNAKPNESCHIVIMANFSGESTRNTSPIATRKLISIDRDNFEQVFDSLKVSCQLPLSEQPISFNTLDDMHPDYLYENLSLFDHFKTLKRKLKSSAKFSEAASEIYQWHDSHAIDKRATAPTPNSSALSDAQSELSGQDSLNKDSFLDDILSAQKNSVSRDQFNIAGLIKDIVAPYVEPKPAPQQKELLKTVDQATSELMRKLMHHEIFQNLESTWRSLYMLVKRIETDQKLKLFIVDVSEQELMKDTLSSDSVEDSQLYKLLVSGSQSVGSTPFNLLMHDAVYGHNLVDINSLNNLSEVAEACGASLVVGGTEKLAGCESLCETPEKDDWHYQTPTEISEAWSMFQASPQASGLIAVSPRFLSRMPYGKSSSPIDSFSFEELTEQQRHRYYLWSNGAWLVTLLAAKNFTESDSLFSGKIQHIDGLPLHVYEEDGESIVTPCAEIHMTDSTSHALREVGLTSIRSIVNKDSVVIPNIMPVASQRSF